MRGFVRFVDRLSLGIGHAFAWCVVILMLAISYEVLVRYVFRAPTSWAFDISYMMYGALFFMAGAYALSRGGHVRGDILYRNWSPRRQAGTDLVLFVVFFFPGVLALIYAGFGQAAQAWGYGEVSVYSPANIPVYPLRALVPLGAFFLALQGVAEVCRCLICLREGAWPRRLHDVEELENQIIEQHRAEVEAAESRP
jgi:TRAP-type mannitol/chloroaromatic compound transport system permease small subunit